MHVFVLFVFMGYGADRSLVSDDMYFQSIDHCNLMASKIVKRHSSHGISAEDRVVAYCMPVKVDEIKETVY
tara:strand:- start:1465 stop:1677 length:213 start_codon:yes stop_codon:yes gene_type:complete